MRHITTTLLCLSLSALALPATAGDADLGVTKIAARGTPDITVELFWHSMHPYLKQGAHNYCHAKMEPYPQKFYADFVRQQLQEEPTGEYFIRFYIYRCVWANRSCDEDGDFDKNQRLRFDVHYDFDC